MCSYDATNDAIGLKCPLDGFQAGLRPALARRRQFAHILALLLLAGCMSEAPTVPRVDHISPSFGSVAGATHVVITGQFWLKPHVDFRNDRSRVEATFTAALGDLALANVSYVDSTTLIAMVPATLPIGRYDLMVSDPDDRSGTLTNAFVVLSEADVITGSHCETDDDCAGDACVTVPFCLDGACLYRKDADGDLFVDAACGGTDCDDDPATCGADCYPGNAAADLCDGHDADCDGTIDEDHPLAVTGCGQGACAGNTGQLDCQDGTPLDTCDAIMGATAQDDTWDGVDDDCDGATDEDVAAAVAHSFVDGFDDGAIGSEWSVASSTGCTVQETGGRTQYDTDGSSACHCSLTTVAPFDLTGSYVAVNVPAITNFYPELFVFLRLTDVNGDTIEFGFENDEFVARVFENDVETFSDTSVYPPRPPYWRIREDAGELFFESSSDGSTWDVEMQTPLPFAVTAVSASFGVETSGTMGGSVGIGIPGYNTI
jgi:hypothetical protein